MENNDSTLGEANKNEEKARTESLLTLAEANWFHGVRTNPTFDQLQHLLVDCCRRLNAIHKVHYLPGVPKEDEAESKPSIERFSLQSRLEHESLSAVVTLCGQKVVQAEVSLKYAKSASGFYRATAQPEFHWKMQQLLDAANAIVRALQSLCQGRKKYGECVQKGCATAANETDLHQFILSVFNAVKVDIKRARLALTMPKKKSLVELCNFHPIKSFVPPLPHDILLSFYLSSAKIVCAAYQVASANGRRIGTGGGGGGSSSTQQTVTIFQAECLVPRLVDIVHLLNSAFAIAHNFTSNFCLSIARTEL
uniref:Mediator of RNA polymerase II transcription subunit 11 n=1 Tax=Globodera pallida TaxID=36090 RepID=A0A183BLY2_GLOPA